MDLWARLLQEDDEQSEQSAQSARKGGAEAPKPTTVDRHSDSSDSDSDGTDNNNNNDDQNPDQDSDSNSSSSAGSLSDSDEDFFRVPVPMALQRTLNLLPDRKRSAPVTPPPEALKPLQPEPKVEATQVPDGPRLLPQKSSSMSRPSRPASLHVQSPFGRRQRFSMLSTQSPVIEEFRTSSSGKSSPALSSFALRHSASVRRPPPAPGSTASYRPERQSLLSLSSNGETILSGIRSDPGFTSDMRSLVLSEADHDEHAGPERSTRVLKIWDSVARCLEEISTSLDPSPATDAPVPQSATFPPHFPSAASVASRRRPSEFRPFTTDEMVDRLASAVSPGESSPDQQQFEYSCPFRKRNPARFNVRDYERCATTPLGSLAEVRNHITTFHRRPMVLYQCRRCKSGFKSQSEHEDHLMLPKERMCDTVPAEIVTDPEDGITDAIETRLATPEEASAGVWTWEEIWRLIFPRDDEIPDSDFLPVVELAELEQQFDEGQEALKASLQDTLRMLLPGSVDDDYCRFLTGQLELVFETHRSNTVRQSLNRLQTAPHASGKSRRASWQGGGLVRRQTRRSRRSAILQHGIRVSEPTEPTTIDSRTGGLTSPSPARRARGNSDTRHPAISPTYTDVSVTISPAATPHSLNNASHHTNKQHTPIRPEHLTVNTDYHLIDNSGRESRDSGIGISCDSCESGIGSCRCSREAMLSHIVQDEDTMPQLLQTEPRADDTTMTHARGLGISVHSPTRQTAHPQQQHASLIPTPTSPGQRHSLSTSTLRHQPKLRVKTRDINSTSDSLCLFGTPNNRSAMACTTPEPSSGTLSSAHDSGVIADEDYSYSPQSFKQRVLSRKQRSPLQQRDNTASAPRRG